MKKYIFIIANGAGSQVASYFHGFKCNQTDNEPDTIETSYFSNGAKIILSSEVEEVTERISRINSNLSVILCEVETKEIDILA